MDFNSPRLWAKACVCFCTSGKKEIAALEKSQQDKGDQIQKLQKQLTDATQAHQTEIVKLRLQVKKLFYFFPHVTSESAGIFKGVLNQ